MKIYPYHETIMQQFHVTGAALNYFLEICPLMKEPCPEKLKCGIKTRIVIRRSTNLFNAFLELPWWKKALLNWLLR